MAYKIFTMDDFVSHIPTMSIIGVLVFGVIRGVTFLVRLLPLPITTTQSIVANNADDTSTIASSSSTTTMSGKIHITSIVFLLLLSYLLSPLSTMAHLRGFRISDPKDQSHGLHDLVYGSDPLLQQVLAQTPSLIQGPNPPFLLSNRHLQFIPWLIQNELHRVEGIPFERLTLTVTACVDKSQGTDHCHRSQLMEDIVTLDVFPPFETSLKDGNNNGNSTKYEGFHAGSPIIFFSPGLRCYSQDMPGNMIIRRAFGAGFRSIVVNRRGHTPDQKLTAPRWNLFGDVDDLEQIYWHIQKQWAAPHTPFFLHGISSGTAVVVSALSEYDRRRQALEVQQQLEPQQQQQTEESHESTNVAMTHTTTSINLLPRVAPSFVASISITPGYDISKVLLPERFKYPYNPVMLDAVKSHFIRDNEELLRAYDSEAVDAALKATHLQELVDAAAPFAGYPNATEYYKGENPVNWMHHVTTPTLVLNAIDDPCCHVHNIYEQSPYPQHDEKSYATLIDESERGVLAVTKSGSHCPFLDSDSSTFNLLPSFIRDPLYGGWMLDSWADRVSIEFYKAALDVYEERRFMQ